MILHDPTANDLAMWVVQSPESQIVAAIVGFVVGAIVAGFLALILAR